MTHLIYSALPQPRPPVIYIHSQASVAQCVEMMSKKDIGALVVQDGKDLLGMVTERDIVRNCVNQGLDAYRTTAADIAYSEVSILSLFDPVEKAMEVITRTRRRHVLVAEHDEIVAILSIGDVLFHLLEDKARVIEQLENYIQVSY
ncbi:CBS domain-containing protein [Legionella fairfieldensis]|uniref:CBS domain-containing protein n=1 Tax=Legionella fairfieldensis TaxID=45064 RepID=UPI00048E0F36|nr:CBS domain-containing protein [Legionella fairfieldensis]